MKKKTNKEKPEHYIDNKEFLRLMVEFKEKTSKAEAKGKEKPRIPDEIGEIFVKIASHLSYKSNFINYAFREDMISDGIENCIQYIHNFDPAKSKNPFAYFTQIIYYAFLRRIQKEKKQLYVRYKSLENQQLMSDLNEEDHSNISSIGVTKLYDNMSEFIQTYEEAMEKKKEIKSKQRKATAAPKKKAGKKNGNNVLRHATNLSEEEKV